MISDWRKFEFHISIAGLFLTLVFLLIYAVPVLGYLVQIGAIFSVIYFAFRRRNLLLGIGSIGSLLIGGFIIGLSPVLVAAWAGIVIPSAVLGRMMAVGGTPSKAFGLGMLLAAGIAIAFFLIEKEAIFAGIDNFRKGTMLLVSNLDVHAVSRERLIDSFSALFTIIKRLLPSFMALSAVTQLFLGWVLLMVLLRALGEFFPSMGNFVHWKMPYYYIYVTGALILLRLVGTELIRVFADNGILYVGFFYAVFGFSLIEYYLKKIRLSLFLKILFYVGFVFLQLPGLLLAAMIGLFDSYFDFRRVRARIIG